MGHTHNGRHPPVSPRTRRILFLSVLPFAVGTLVGLFLLWPDGTSTSSRGPEPRYAATVTDVEPGGCAGTVGNAGFTCSLITARVDDGPDRGELVSFDYSSRA